MATRTAPAAAGTRRAQRSAAREFVRDNGLSLAFLGLFAASWIVMSVSGLFVEDQERAEHLEAAVAYLEYVTSAHLLFAVSWFGHAWSGTTLYNQEQAMHGGTEIGILQFVATSEFWFETLQNWQSEWIAIFTLVVLAIFLRQRGSSESKPVFEPNTKTGRG